MNQPNTWIEKNTVYMRLGNEVFTVSLVRKLPWTLPGRARRGITIITEALLKEELERLINEARS